MISWEYLLQAHQIQLSQSDHANIDVCTLFCRMYFNIQNEFKYVVVVFSRLYLSIKFLPILSSRNMYSQEVEAKRRRGEGGRLLWKMQYKHEREFLRPAAPRAACCCPALAHKAKFSENQQQLQQQQQQQQQQPPLSTPFFTFN